MTTQIFSKTKAIGPAGQPEVFVAAFGKHPAWNDFIDDPGLETDRLIAVKRVLYLEGIAAAIDTGAWDKLDASKRTEGFSHLIVWRSRSDIVVCRLWSSSDGKGRTKYPMVVVAQCRGLSLAWVIAEALPRLERLERRCTEATTQEQVKAALDATRSELRARAAVAEGAAPIQAAAVAEVADALSAGGSRDPFYRLMYQIERDWTPFLVRREGTLSTRSWSGDTRSQHVRVPTGTGDAGAELSRWFHFVLNLVDTATSVTLVRNISPEIVGGWTDIIVGEPEGQQFFCIRASDQSLPLATSIPYTLDPELKARSDRLVDDARAGRLAARKPEVITKAQPGFFDRVKVLLGGKKKGLLVLFIAVGLVGMGIALVMIFSGGGNRGGGGGAPNRDRTRAETPREHPPPRSAQQHAPAPTIIPAAEAGEWGRLCAAYHDWFSEFEQRLQKRPAASGIAAAYKTRADFYATDPYLKGLLDRLKAAQGSGKGIDPWSIAGVARSHDLAALAKNPPASVAEPAAKTRIDEAMAIIDGFSVRLVKDWPALRKLEAAAASLEASGRGLEAAYLRSLASVEGVGGGGPAQGIDAVLAASELVSQLQRRLEVRDTCATLARESGNKVLERFEAWAAQETASAETSNVDLASLENLSRALARVEEVAAPLLAFLKEGWAKTDTQLLAKRELTAPQGLYTSAPTRETFLTWLELAKRTPKLDPATDPRRTSPASDLLKQSQASRRRLEEEFKVTPEKRLTDLEASASHALDELARVEFNAETQSVIASSLSRVESELRELKQAMDNAVAMEAARRAGSAREVRDELEAQQTIVARSAAINAAWRTRRDELLKTIPDAEYDRLRVQADKLRVALTALDAAVPAGLDGQGTALEESISSASWTERERAITAALSEWSGISDDPEGKALERAGERAASEYAKHKSELLTFKRDLETVASHMAAGALLAEKTEAGEPLASVVERCRRSPLLRDAGLATAARAVMEQVDAVERIESLVGADELAAAAEAALPDRWVTALGAWRRLGRLTSPAWPDSVAALQREEALSARLLQAVAGAGGARRAEIEKEIHEQRAARWARAFEILTDPADIEVAAVLASEMGVEPMKLPPHARYNLELAEFRRAATTRALTDERARRLAHEFEEKVGRMGSRVGSLPGVQQLLARLGPISGREAPPTPVIDVTRLGPGAAQGRLAGFTGRVEGNVLRFTRGEGPGEITIDFVRVEGPGVETFFVSTTEVSLGQFVAIIDGANAWADLRELFVVTQPDDDFRKGPRVWVWTEEAGKGPVMRPPDKWLRSVTNGRTVPESPPALASGPPGLSHPVNYLPPGAAILAAHLAGCRLPTLAEWKAALAKTGGGQDLHAANLRDAKWKAEQAYINDLSRAGSVNWPDDDIFLPARGPRVRTGPDAQSHAWDDGFVWLAPVDKAVADTNEPMRHVVGNVSEYVVDAAPAEILPAGGPSGAGAKAMVARLRDSFRVIGGSALSPIDLPALEAWAVDVDEAAGGYADVGFRFAFSAAGAGPVAEPLGVQLGRVLSEATYIIEGKGK